MSTTTDQQCPACGWPDLPTIAAETLHRQCGHNAVALPPLPVGDLPVMGGGRWYRMPPDAWAAYRSLCAQADSLLGRMAPAAARRRPFLFFWREFRE